MIGDWAEGLEDAAERDAVRRAFTARTTTVGLLPPARHLADVAEALTREPAALWAGEAAWLLGVCARDVRIPGAEEALRRAVAAGDETVRFTAIQAIAFGLPRSEETDAALVAALDDPAPGVAAKAMSLAANRRLAAVGPPAERWLLEGEPTEVRRMAAAITLGYVPTPTAIQTLTRALADPSEDVRIAAAGSLGMLGDRRAAGPLHARLNDVADRPAKDERLVIEEALAELSDDDGDQGAP